MIRLLADSTCDLSPELAERYHVEILPLNVNLGEESHTDGVDITPQEIFAWSDRTHDTPKTAVFSMDKARKRFKSYLEAGDDLICFSISSKMSASGQVMRMAAEELNAPERFHIIDSQNLSTGIGLLILRAADLIAEGLPVDEVVRQVKETRHLVRASFVVDTLTFLHRGGRCSGLASLMGSMLKIHPKIVVEDGAMHPDAKYRGSMQRVLSRYVEDLEPAMQHARRERVFVTHSCYDNDLPAEVISTLRQLNLFDEILETHAGCVISSHCGPNTLGVLFVAEEA